MRRCRELDQLGFAYDSSQGYADGPGMRAGLSLPYRPYDLAADRPLDMLELPLVVMDATLAEDRYLGLEADAGLDRAVAVLERAARRRRRRVGALAQRPLRPRLRSRAGTAPTTACCGGCASAAGGWCTAAEAVGLDGAATPRR